MTAKLRVGVVGYGAIGRHHARNLAQRPDVDFAGIADPSPAAREAATAAGFRAFASVEALAASGLDAAVVAVPTSLHERAAEPLFGRPGDYRPFILEGDAVDLGAELLGDQA